MNKFTLLVFVASILLVGCTASKHLMNAPESSPEKEEMQRKEVQRSEFWKCGTEGTFQRRFKNGEHLMASATPTQVHEFISGRHLR